MRLAAVFLHGRWKIPGRSRGRSAEVESVVNCRVSDRRHLIVGVSGGVTVDASPFVRADRVQVDDYGLLQAERENAAAENRQPDAWWWD